MSHTIKQAARKHAAVTGFFFIAAAVTAITGLYLYDPILNSPDYLVLGATSSNQIISGAVLELLLACTATGTSIMMYPYLCRFNERLGLAYVCFRLFEVIFILIGIVSVLALLTLSHAYTAAGSVHTNVYAVCGKILQSIHDWTFILGPNFMLGINTFIYSYVFYRSGLVPKALAQFGMIAAGSIFTAALLEMFGVILQLSVWGILLALPIFFFEMILAVWLIIKGFRLNILPQD